MLIQVNSWFSKSYTIYFFLGDIIISKNVFGSINFEEIYYLGLMDLSG